MCDFLESFAQRILYLTNLLVFLCAVPLLGLSIWVLVDEPSFLEVIKVVDIGGLPLYRSAVITLIVVSAACALITFFGCVGAAKNDICLLGIYSILVFILLAIVALGAFLSFTSKDNAVQQAMTEAIKRYDPYRRGELERAMDTFQQDFECCGMNGPNDWARLNDNFGNNPGDYPSRPYGNNGNYGGNSYGNNNGNNYGSNSYGNNRYDNNNGNYGNNRYDSNYGSSNYGGNNDNFRPEWKNDNNYGNNRRNDRYNGNGWEAHENQYYVPKSCCRPGSNQEQCAREESGSGRFQSGCLTLLEDEISKHSNWLGIVALVLVITLALDFAIAVYMCNCGGCFSNRRAYGRAANRDVF